MEFQMKTILNTQTIDAPQIEDHVSFASHQIVLYNDNVNTIEHVIRCLIHICKHTIEVARQIALEAHREGRSIAYIGSHDECLDRKIQLQNERLTVQVESI